MAAEALALHIEGLAEDHEAMPSSSSLDAIMSDPNNREAVAFQVDAAVPPSRAMRINVTLPADLVRAIDRISGNRSRFLAEAAREKLQSP